MEVANGGQLYVLNGGTWYVWSGSSFTSVGSSIPSGGGGSSTSLTGATTFPTTKSFLSLTAGVPTQTWGQEFHDGDMPVGSVPTLTIAGVAQPYSAGLQSYWPSGCLKFCTLIMIPTASGNQTLTIGAVAGSWPAASGRTINDVYSQNLVVNGPALSSVTGGIGQTRAVSAWCNGDVNTVKVSTWYEGQAGRGFKVTVNMAPTQGATKDPQLMFDFYVQALGAGATPLGFRWSGCMRAPNFLATNQSSFNFFFAPPNATTPSAGLNWSANGTVRPATWPASWTPATDVSSSVPFSGVGSITNNELTITSVTSGALAVGDSISGTSPLGNGSYIQALGTGTGGLGTYSVGNLAAGTNVASGPVFVPGVLNSTQAQAWATGSQNMVPVILSGSVPGGLGGAGAVWWSQVGNGGTAFYVCGSPSITGTSVSPTSAGTFTATPVPGFCYFTRLSFAGPDAKAMYFQGTGTQASETTSRDQINQLYKQSSKLIPPYDTTINGTTNGGVIADTTYPFDWNPFSMGSVGAGINSGGDSPFIGALMNQQVVDFYNQSALSEKQVRILGWCGGLMPYDVKDVATDTNINMSGNTYAGLGAPNPTITWGGRGSTGASGFTSPDSSGLTSVMCFDASDASHTPFFCYWPYLRTGELQFFDMLVDSALGMALLANAGRNPNTGSGDTPYNATGIWTYANQQYRGEGWAGRNMHAAGLVAPYNPTAPTVVDFDGSQRSKYINDVCDASSNFLIDQWNWGKTNGGANGGPNPIYPAYAQTASLWANFNNYGFSGQPGYEQGPFWEQCYVGIGECYSAMRGNAKAVQFLELLGARATYVGSTYGFYSLYAYNQAFCIDSPLAPNNGGQVMISSDHEFTISQISAVNGNPSLLGWTTGAGPACFFFTQLPNNGWVPQNGDVITPYDGNGPSRPSEIADGSFYQIVDYTVTPSGPNYATFGLAPYGSTTATPISSGGSGGGQTMIFNFMPVAPGPQNSVPFAGNFMLQVGECANFSTAVNASGWATTVADVNRRVVPVANGVRYWQPSGDGYNPTDCRYCVVAAFA